MSTVERRRLIGGNLPSVLRRTTCHRCYDHGDKRPKATKKPSKLTHAWVGRWQLLRISTGHESYSDTIKKMLPPPSFPSRTISALVIIWACSSRGLRAVTLAPFKDASNASNTIPFARSPTACTFWEESVADEELRTEQETRLTTCQPSRRNFGITSKSTSGSRRRKPLVSGLSA